MPSIKELDYIGAEYQLAGLPGCVSSVDCVHVRVLGVSANLKQISTGKEHFPSRVSGVAVSRRGLIVSATKGFYGCVVDMTIVKSDSAMLAMKDGVYSEYEYLLYDAEGKTNFVKSDIISAGSRKKRQRVYGSSIVDVCLTKRHNEV